MASDMKQDERKVTVALRGNWQGFFFWMDGDAAVMLFTGRRTPVAGWWCTLLRAAPAAPVPDRHPRAAGGPPEG